MSLEFGGRGAQHPISDLDAPRPDEHQVDPVGPVFGDGEVVAGAGRAAIDVSDPDQGVVLVL